ncbi:MAG: ABC transporter ATP-binding protein [Clostridiales bacterium]|jgi:ATP-binding cassette subfamily B protein|nr:ABC transporter ATP-binding protein [Clostridiales bacterium]
MKAKKQTDKNEMSVGYIIKRILKDLSHIKGYLILSTFLSLITVVLSLAGPYVLGKLTDEVYNAWINKTPVDKTNFVSAVIILGGIYVAIAVTSIIIMKMMNNVVSRRFTCDLRVRMSAKIKKLPVSFADNTPIGEIISRMTDDVSVLGTTVHIVIDTLINGVLKLVCIAVIIFILNPLLAAIVVVFVPFSVVLAAKMAGKSEKHFTSARDINGKISSHVEENCTGFDTVKAFGHADRQNQIHAGLSGEYKIKCRQGNYLSGMVQPIIAFVDNVAYIAICLLGGYLASTSRMDVGIIVSFALYAKNFSMPLESIAYGFGTMQKTIASARRVYGILDSGEMAETESEHLTNVKGNVTFEKVNFSYKKDTPLIQDFSVDIMTGQKVAIVGPTGAGKTTLVNLLMRFYEPDSGCIRIDGVDITKVGREEVRNQFAMVLQDTWLFSGTVYQNIAYGNPDATFEDVKRAAEYAHIDYFIETLEKGYDTMINEESSNISSGQKQLLTIARAYLSGRKMLILDEATSNVDTRTEILIQHTMDKLMKGKTSFVIAHRLSTIVNADIILVINDGQIVEQGTHSQLLEKGGFYSEIYYSQYEAYNNGNGA